MLQTSNINSWEAHCLNESNSLKFEDILSSAQLSEQWFSKILDSMNDGILVADHHLIVRYINDEYTRITGVASQQIIGKNLTQVRPGAMLPKIIKSGIPVAGVYRREGDIEYVADMAPIRIHGEVVGGVSVVKDITEVKLLSEQVQKYAKKTDRLKTMVNRLYRARYTFEDMIGDSTAISETIKIAKRVARGDADVLIIGESGTGKEVVAQAIHNASDRACGPFVAVNCAAIAPTLIESELFGYEEGTFTGAKKGGKIGLFEMASGGTLFLDEIAELTLEIQAKLLRVLQERAVRRVGEANEVPIDIRILAATNKDLRAMVQAKTFRSDLYYRLNVLNVFLPPLRERGWDIRLLTEVFLSLQARKLGRNLIIDEQVSQLFLHYNWPGNIRELRNVIEHAVNMSEDGTITLFHLPNWLTTAEDLTHATAITLATRVREFERKTIISMMKTYGTGLEAKRRIATELDISVATLYNKIKETDV